MERDRCTVRLAGRSPYAASGVPVRVTEVATGAFIGGVALYVLARALHLQFRLRLDPHSGEA